MQNTRKNTPRLELSRTLLQQYYPSAMCDIQYDIMYQRMIPGFCTCLVYIEYDNYGIHGT